MQSPLVFTLFICLSVSPSVYPHFIVMQYFKMFSTQRPHTQLEDKGRKSPIDSGVKWSKVKVIGICVSCWALTDCVSFLVFIIIIDTLPHAEIMSCFSNNSSLYYGIFVSQAVNLVTSLLG